MPNSFWESVDGLLIKLLLTIYSWLVFPILIYPFTNYPLFRKKKVYEKYFPLILPNLLRNIPFVLPKLMFTFSNRHDFHLKSDILVFIYHFRSNILTMLYRYSPPLLNFTEFYIKWDYETNHWNILIRNKLFSNCFSMHLEHPAFSQVYGKFYSVRKMPFIYFFEKTSFVF